MAEYLEETFDKFIFRVKADYFYNREGFWASFKGSLATLGVTDFLQKSSGDVTLFVPVEPGTAVGQGDESGTIETIKAAFGIISPVSGRVAEINPELENQPYLINHDPYGAGWIYRVELSNPEGDKGLLLPASEYFEMMKQLIGAEAKKLNE